MSIHSGLKECCRYFTRITFILLSAYRLPACSGTLWRTLMLAQIQEFRMPAAGPTQSRGRADCGMVESPRGRYVLRNRYPLPSEQMR